MPLAFREERADTSGFALGLAEKPGVAFSMSFFIGGNLPEHAEVSFVITSSVFGPAGGLRRISVFRPCSG